MAVVTGASSGIGLEIARGLVEQRFHVVLAVRDPLKGELAREEIGGGEVMRLDVADLASVRAFAAQLLARHPALHLLVNNAGIHTSEHRTTREGVESTFATNHLGHYLLTRLLLDALKAGAPSRVVNVASEAHRFTTGIDLDDLGWTRRRWSGLRAYGDSKLANVMFTYALARRLEGTGVAAFAVHPGSVRTNWARGKDSGLFRLGVALASPFLRSPAGGARTPLHAATSSELDGKSGLYLVRRRPATSSAASRDVEAQEALWRESAHLAGLEP